MKIKKQTTNNKKTFSKLYMKETSQRKASNTQHQKLQHERNFTKKSIKHATSKISKE
jgi:hypothetical protein